VVCSSEAGLRPVHGAVDAVHRLLADWLATDDAEPLVVRTSGSTGRAKDVVLSVRAVRASAAATLSRLGGGGQWVVALPVQYVAGLQVLSRSVLAGSEPVDLAAHPGLASATAALSGRCRYLACVPTQLFRWLADRESAAALATYSTVLLGGAAADPDLLGRAADAGVRVVTTYGMSETCGGCVYDGVPLDGVGVALDTGGAIRISGPVLFDGYRGDPARTAEVLRHGWFHTGDVGRFDDDGRLVVDGRSDDVVTSGGVSVSLRSVEERVRRLVGVRDACVVGQPDREWGSRVVAFVVADRPGPTLAAVRDHVAQVFPRTWAPLDVVTVDDLPMLASGKPDRPALVRSLGSSEADRAR
jgi:O-succinylbenzoic acid--CoA ligase